MAEPAASPLLPLHERIDAEMIAYDRWPIVSTFGQPQAEYAAIRKAAGLLDEPYRGVVELTGPERHAFLGNLITNNVYDKAGKSGLAAGSVVYSFLLNLQGRVVLDMNVIERGETTLLETDARLVPTLLHVLDAYRFTEKVAARSLTEEVYAMSLHGPQSADVLGITPLAPMHATVTSLLGVMVDAYRDDCCGVPGYRLLVPRSSAASIWQGLIAAHEESASLGRRALRPVGWAAFNTCRIEAGVPLAGIDFELAAPSLPGKRGDAAPAAGGVLAPETGLFDRAVSVSKGCYLGQEIVARMHARKALARQIAGFRMKSDALPVAGAPVQDEQGRQVGVVTSSSVSPVLSNACIGLALLKKPHFEIGRVVRIAAEGEFRAAEIVATPFYKSEGEG